MAVVPGPCTDVAGSHGVLQGTRQVASFTRIQLMRAGIELMNTAYNYTDLMPKGRDERGRGQFWGPGQQRVRGLRIAAKCANYSGPEVGLREARCCRRPIQPEFREARFWPTSGWPTIYSRARSPRLSLTWSIVGRKIRADDRPDHFPLPHA